MTQLTVMFENHYDHIKLFKKYIFRKNRTLVYVIVD